MNNYNLILVESPTKSRTLQRFLDKKYKVEATMGHVRDLPKSQLGVDIKNKFKPEYIPVIKKQDVITKLKQTARKASQIYIATDPDREGEAIAYHIKYLLTSDGKSVVKKDKISRITFHEITKDAVEHAIEHPGRLNLKLVDAQQARRVLDRLVGYKLSPLLWRKVRRGLSAGRVQSVAVRLIVEREREIEKFKSEEYWEIFVELKAKKGNFVVQLIKVGEKPVKIENEKQASQILADLKKGTYTVANVEKKQTNRSPAPPFTTSTMTQTANRRFGWSSKKTMAVAQRLYEEGMITYHRTDSLSLNPQAVEKARKFIEKRFGIEYLPEKPRFFKTKSKLAQEAHEAIRPTNPMTKPEDAKENVDRDGGALYGLIWRRFVASQMANAAFDQTTIDVETAPHYLLRAIGRIMKFEGWSALYTDAAGKQVALSSDEQELPEVDVGEEAKFIKVDPQQKFTQPPGRFTEASLVKMLEKLGIGRPSTYAPTISTIQARQYVEKDEGKFKPTPVGIAVNDFLIEHFPTVLDYDFTAQMEGDLDDIANGEKKWTPIIKDFWTPFEKTLKATEKAKRVGVEAEKTGKICPKCGKGDEVIRVGRFGKFLSCSRFPDCDYTAHYLEKIGIKCPDCKKGDIIVRKTKKGRKFFGCSRYPTCKFAAWKNPKEPPKETKAS